MEDEKILESGNEGLSRRDFIKTGLAGAAAVGLATAPLDALAQQAKTAPPKKPAEGPPVPPDLNV